MNFKLCIVVLIMIFVSLYFIYETKNIVSKEIPSTLSETLNKDRVLLYKSNFTMRDLRFDYIALSPVSNFNYKGKQDFFFTRIEE